MNVVTKKEEREAEERGKKKAEEALSPHYQATSYPPV